MSQNPYANPYPQQYAQPYPPGGMPPPARTSVMAVLSLVFSLLCCTAPLGIIFGGLALLAIGLSGGKVRGIGLAIAGLVIGIIVTVVILGSSWAAVAGLNLVSQPAATAMGAIARGDADAADDPFTAAAAPSITSRRVDEFRDLLADEVGDFDSGPSGMGDWWSGYAAVFSNASNGRAMEDAQDRYNDVIPVPMRFDTGWQLIFVVIDEDDTDAAGVPKYKDIGFLRDDGSIEWLVAGNDGGGTGGIPNFVPPPPLRDFDLDDPDADLDPQADEPDAEPQDEPAPGNRRTRPGKP